MCEEASNSEESVHFPCREGYVCDFGTTPDPDLEAPEGQFTQLCPVGFVCTDATGLGQAYRQVKETLRQYWIVKPDVYYM